MKKGHALLIALLIGAAALAGIVAATRTAQLGRSSHPPKVSPAEIAVRNRALDRTRANLHKLLAEKPAAGPARPAAAQRVVYVRPAPRIVTINRAHSGEREAEGAGHEGGGGGFDD